MASKRIRKNATVEIGIVKMTIEDFEKSIKRIETDITLAKFLSELKVNKNDMNQIGLGIMNIGNYLKKLFVRFQM